MVSDTTDVFERDTILFPAFDLTKCVGCGRCVISCNDGGHQAIEFEERKPKNLSETNAWVVIYVSSYVQRMQLLQPVNA